MKQNIVFILAFLWVAIVLAVNVDDEHHSSNDRMSGNHHRHEQSKPDENDAKKSHENLDRSSKKTKHSEGHAEHGKHQVKSYNEEQKSHQDEHHNDAFHGIDRHSEHGYNVRENVKDVPAPTYNASRRLSLPFIGDIPILEILKNVKGEVGCLSKMLANMAKIILDQLRRNPTDGHHISLILDERVIYQKHINDGLISCRNKTGSRSVSNGLKPFLGKRNPAN